ncbi:MAG: seryl-tRNA synthetase, partial [Bacteroidia bacterium]
MLQTTYIQENKQDVIDRLVVRGIDATETVNQIISLDDRRKATQAMLDSTLAEANQLAKEIGGLFKQGKAQEANAAKTKAAALKEQSSALQE